MARALLGFGRGRTPGISRPSLLSSPGTGIGSAGHPGRSLQQLLPWYGLVVVDGGTAGGPASRIVGWIFREAAPALASRSNWADVPLQCSACRLCGPNAHAVHGCHACNRLPVWPVLIQSTSLQECWCPPAEPPPPPPSPRLELSW